MAVPPMSGGASSLEDSGAVHAARQTTTRSAPSRAHVTASGCMRSSGHSGARLASSRGGVVDAHLFGGAQLAHRPDAPVFRIGEPAQTLGAIAELPREPDTLLGRILPGTRGVLVA